MSTEGDRPLGGITVVEFGGNIAGPYASWILAQLGAEVIKIERPGAGDDARGWGPPFVDDSAALFHLLNRDKTSVAADLRDETTVARLKEFILADVDVVVQNMRAGVLDGLGLGAETLTTAKPALVYCSLHAFGATGPMADRPGYDALMQAYGGIMSVTGHPGAEPARAGVSIIDCGAGMWSAIGILAALARRASTGRGGIVDTSLFETAVGWMSLHLSQFAVTGKVPGPQGTGSLGIAPYQAYPCSDGMLMVAAPNDRMFARLAGALGHPEWATDPRFAAGADRARNKSALNAAMSETMADDSRATWRERLDAVGVPSAPVQDAGELAADPQTEALDILQAVPGMTLAFAALPLSLDSARPAPARRAPELGADDARIFGPAGKN